MIEVIVLGVILVVSILFLKFKVFNSAKSVKYGKSIIFCGSRDSGKTTLLLGNLRETFFFLKKIKEIYFIQIISHLFLPNLNIA